MFTSFFFCFNMWHFLVCFFVLLLQFNESLLFVAVLFDGVLVVSKMVFFRAKEKVPYACVAVVVVLLWLLLLLLFALVVFLGVM